MLPLGPGDTLQGLGSVASKLTITVAGLELAGGAEKFKILAQRSLPAAAEALYVGPADGAALVRSIAVTNTDVATRMLSLYVNGSGDANLWYRTNIPAGGAAAFDGTWQVFDADGKLQSSGGGSLTDHTHAAAGAGATGGGATLAPGTFTFPTGTAPAQTSEGQATWDTDDDLLVVGTGAAQRLLGKRPQVDVFSSGSNTWAKPAGAVAHRVRLVGAGGAGGGVAATGASTQAVGGGGGGGGFAEKWFASSALAASETVDVGGAGAAGAAGANAGGAGGDSRFATGKAYVVTGTGGAGGTGGAASSAGPISEGGAGGAGTGGDLNVGGGDGSNAKLNAGVVVSFGNGGGTALGGTSVTTAISAAGATGKSYGGGGSGASNGNSQSARAGGAGAAGIVIVETYF